MKFPYKPYYVQIEYIKRVIDSLEEKGKHAILESPTGLQLILFQLTDDA